MPTENPKFDTEEAEKVSQPSDAEMEWKNENEQKKFCTTHDCINNNNNGFKI